MEAVGYGHKAGSSQLPDPHFVLFNSSRAPEGSSKPGQGLPSPFQFILNRFIRRTQGNVFPPGAPRLCPSPSLMIKRVPTRLSFVKNDFFLLGREMPARRPRGEGSAAGFTLLSEFTSHPAEGSASASPPAGGAGSLRGSSRCLHAPRGVAGEPGLGGDGSTRVGLAPKAGAEPGAHTWHGQGRERDEGGGGTAGAGASLGHSRSSGGLCRRSREVSRGRGRGESPGLLRPAPRCPGPASTRGRGRVAAAPSGPGPRSLRAPHQLLPARPPSAPKSPFPTCCSRRRWSLFPLYPQSSPGRGLQPGLLPLPAGAHPCGSRRRGSPSPLPGTHLSGDPSAAVSPPTPLSPGESPGHSSRGSPGRESRGGGSLGGGALAAAPRLPHCLRCVPRLLLVPPASHPPRRSLPSPATAPGRNTGHMLRGHKLGRSANTLVPGWLF